MKLELPNGVSILANEIDSFHPGRSLLISLPDKRQRGSSLRSLKQSNSLSCLESAVCIKAFPIQGESRLQFIVHSEIQKSLKVSRTISTREQMELNRNFK